MNLDKRKIPKRQEQERPGPHGYKLATFKPPTDVPKGKRGKLVERGEQGHKKWENFEVHRGSSLAYHEEFQTSKQLAYRSKNYKGKNSMSRSQ